MTVTELSTGKTIREFYANQKSLEVNQILSGLYRKVRAANPHIVVHDVMPQDKFLDRMSFLFMGNERCAAVAFSENDILVATNEPLHQLASFKYKFAFKMQKKGMVLEWGQPILVYHIVVICTLNFDDGTTLSQESQPVIYRDFSNTGGELQILNMDMDRKVNFLFPHESFSKRFEKDIKLQMTLKTGKCPELSLALYQMKEGSIQEWDYPIYSPTNELEKRVVDVLNNLALYAKFYDFFRKFTDETKHPKLRPYKALVSEALSKMDCPEIVDPKEFAKSLVLQNRDTIKFSSDAEYSTTVGVITNLFYDMRKINRLNQDLKKDCRWPIILSESLTLVLSSLSSFNKFLGDDQDGKANRNELFELYKRMVEDYQVFKKKEKCHTTEASVIEWFKTLEAKQDDGHLKFPSFVKERFNTQDIGFLDNTKRHFVALAYLQEFVVHDALNQGALSRALLRESVFERSAQVKIVDGDADTHAEMRLFDYHLSKTNGVASDYFGISKLCCALCNYTFGQFSASGQRVPRTQGYHAGIFDKWALLKSFDDESKMRIFLGDDLFSIYLNLKGKSLKLSKHGDPYTLWNVVKHLIYRLASINNKPTMKVLQIEGDPMPQPKTLYS